MEYFVTVYFYGIFNWLNDNIRLSVDVGFHIEKNKFTLLLLWVNWVNVICWALLLDIGYYSGA